MARQKTGGRKPGTPNKATTARMVQMASGGEMPLDYMLRVLRDPTVDHSRRDEMARCAAPYVHPKLATTEIKGDPDKPVQHKVEVVFVSA